MNRDLMFSQGKGHQDTPRDLFDALNAEFQFTHDAAADESNTLVSGSYWSPEQNALAQSWLGRGTIWCNPPYGRDIGRWLLCGYLGSHGPNASVSVFLLPARTDTKWFHEWAPRAEVRFLKGRIKFSGARAGAPFPSILLIFRPSRKRTVQGPYSWLEL